VPSAEVFVRECRTLSVDGDVMGLRGTYHLARVQELVRKFPEWREQRLPGTRAFQSTYDRIGVSVCRWLFLMLHDSHAISVFDYIVPLMVRVALFLLAPTHSRYFRSLSSSGSQSVRIHTCILDCRVVS
jgi:proteasome activator subunit 4